MRAGGFDMLVYWAMFALPALSTMAIGTRPQIDRAKLGYGAIALLLLFTLLIGLRDEVGTDWFNYERTLATLSYSGFGAALGYKDPAYGILAWTSTRFGWDMYMPDLVCAAIMMFGLAMFVRRQRDVWLAITAAVPYLLIVVGMGYVRQAAAIGCMLVAITKLEQRQFVRYAAWTLAGALFHSSSICIVPLIGLTVSRKRKILLMPVGVASVILYVLLLRDRVDSYYALYSSHAESIDSSGALVRLTMNAVPAVIFLAFRRRFVIDEMMAFFWTLCSLVSLALVVALFMFPSSTVVDRLGLYFIPIQLLVFGNLSYLISDDAKAGRLLSFLAILYYGMVLFVWLNFATNAHNWLPYKFVGLS